MPFNFDSLITRYQTDILGIVGFLFNVQGGIKKVFCYSYLIHKLSVKVEICLENTIFGLKIFWKKIFKSFVEKDNRTNVKKKKKNSKNK